MSDEILGLDETLKALGGISISTLRRMMNRGEITPVEEPSVLRRRRALRFRRSEINRALQEAQDKEAHSRLRVA